MKVSKTILCGTALSAIVLALPAHAQVTIGGDPIEVTDGVVTDAQNVGGGAWI